jgi:hypothetical protein
MKNLLPEILVVKTVDLSSLKDFNDSFDHEEAVTQHERWYVCNAKAMQNSPKLSSWDSLTRPQRRLRRVVRVIRTIVQAIAASSQAIITGADPGTIAGNDPPTILVIKLKSLLLRVIFFEERLTVRFLNNFTNVVVIVVSVIVVAKKFLFK